MGLREAIRHLRAKPADAIWFWQGTVRYWLFQYAPFLLGRNLKASVETRKRQAWSCYTNGSCMCCGCPTPQLFWADKGCSAGSAQSPPRCRPRAACYPPRHSWLYRLVQWLF
ncbi:hypothetical protein FAES_3245 [Fibrella aestuarina BUZ 2]|uniref:Uncharacterized protein n=1 Tax=Fibrella aestuarina BUZ 2 TaxID=1166018 RepID=I0KAV1_9BACT|nr:hypothetical protein FAES_3245 [Fibrella aestuarina BUZ 2]